MYKKIIIVFIVAQSVLSVRIPDDLVITLPDGKIQGRTYVTQNNKTYFGFQGIPFATPPTGNLRFEAPQKPQPWNDILDATKDSKACISTNHWRFPESESEDCLYINVYIPSIKSADKLAVLFWIYGGAYVTGSSSKLVFGPDFLIEENVIVVTSNYRLAPFGFLSTGDEAIRGNAALKDQNLALRWTFENIALFGGDPQKITIFGQSAGAVSTAFQVLSKKSAGLFRAAIIESGSALNPWAVDQDPKTYAFALADTLPGGSNYKNDTQKLKQFLQEKTTDEIINATLATAGQVYPVLEGDGEDAFITESPYELLESGRFNQVPIITGICSEESLMTLQNIEYAKQLAQAYDADSEHLIPTDLYPNSTTEGAVSTAVRDIYLKDRETFTTNLVSLAKLLTDDGFSRGFLKLAELSSNFIPVYLYQFAYYGRPIFPAFIDGAEKAGHSAELPFIFNMIGLSNTTTPSDILTQNRITKLWANFAKFLNPTPDESDLFNNIIWPTINSTNKPYFNLNSTVEIRSNLKEEAFSKWTDIYETFGRKPFITY